jgi:hypothetical protein
MAPSTEAAPSDSNLKLALSIIHTSAPDFKIDWEKVMAMNDIPNAPMARMRWTRLKKQYEGFLGEKPPPTTPDDSEIAFAKGPKTPRTPKTAGAGRKTAAKVAAGDESPSKSTGKGRKKNVDVAETVGTGSSEETETTVKASSSKSVGKGRKKKTEEGSASDADEKIVKKAKVEHVKEGNSKEDNGSENDGRLSFLLPITVY